MSKPQFVYVSYIETTPERLWEALTSSEFTRQYWFGAEVRSDWKVGSPFALTLDGEVTDSGEILEADPPRRLSYSFKHQKFEELRGEPISRVVFTIEPFGSLVRLTVLHDGFVARYDTGRTDDGLPPGEGTFLACTFWLADAYVLTGRMDDARRLFERLLAIRNDVGLLAEEYDVREKCLVGNFPQAFSHVALINTALNLQQIKPPAEQRADKGRAGETRAA